MGNSIFTIGVTGLNAAQAGILTTGHNIANASTPGFTRQQVVQTTNTPMGTGAGFLGQGTNVQTIKRIFNEALNSQMLSAQNGTAEMDGYQAQISQIDTLLADPSAGLSSGLSAFFNGVQGVAADPLSIPARQAMLSGAQALVSRFQSLNQRLSDIRTGTDAQITSEATVINAYAQQIADVNQSIVLAQGNGTGQPANDLLDQRDQIISDLNKEIRVSTVMQSDGTYTVFIGNGQPLVVGNQVSTLRAVPASDQPQKITLAIQATASSSPVALQEAMLSGGKLGGLLAFRSQSLDAAQNALGRIATGLAQTFNDQHKLGQDLTGALGGNFFTVPPPMVTANTVNAGTAKLSAQIVNSDYRLDVNAAGKYDVTRLSGGTTIPPPPAGGYAVTDFPVNVDGVTLTLGSGTTTFGDSFVVRPGNPADSRVVASSGNAPGAASPDSNASNIQSLEASDYRLSYIATDTFTLTRLSDNTHWTGAGTDIPTALTTLAAQHQTGITLSFTNGTPAVGDNFIIQPTRNAAGSISLAINDPNNIAVAAPIRSAIGTANTGTAQISAPTVYDKSFLPLQATTTLTYSNGVFVVSGAVPAVPNAIAYPATISHGTSTGSVTPTWASPFVAGTGDKFDIALDGLAAQTVTLSGSYASASALATAIQTAINSNGVISAANASVTVSVVSGKLQVTSNSLGTPSKVTLSATLPGPNTGYANLFGTPTEVDGSAVTANTKAVSFNGMSFSISGTPQNGDTYTLDKNSGGVSDNRNALLLAQLQTQNTLVATSGGSAKASYQSAYSEIVSEVGNKAREVQVTGQGMQSLADQARSARDSASGVNLDEEAANLLRYQQAYQAAAKMITVAGKLFDTLLAI